MVDYREFRLSKLNTPEFSHLKYLLYWPVYGLVFMILERFLTLDYTYVHCALDDVIPFVEYFIVPYLFWFVYLVGMILYTLFFDVKSFVYMMKLIIITCSAACITYIIFPTAQNLRPETFARDNIFTDIVRAFYAFDTNTNVCPSVHVSAAVVVMMSAWNSRHFNKPLWRLAFVTTTVLISLSTVFLKQHSAIDVAGGAVVCVAAGIIVRIFDAYKAKRANSSAAKV